MPRIRRPFLTRLLFAVPILGWMLRDVAEGDEHALGWFALTIVALLAIAALSFGLPGLVAGMLAAAVLTLGTILLITMG